MNDLYKLKKRRAGMLYRLRRKGVAVDTKERTIHCNECVLKHIKEIKQVKCLMSEFGFGIQLKFE
jgi:tRNA U55 pseudouridine synthase TruB